MALKRRRVADTNQVKAHVTRKRPRMAETKHLKARAVRKRPRVPQTKQVKAREARERPLEAETKQVKARAARKRPRVPETDQVKARRSTKRRRKGPPFDGEALCPDLKQLITERLSFRHLARAAATCRYFQKAYLDRAAEERAKLIAAAEGASGKALLSTFATGLRRAMSGFVSFPGLGYDAVERGVMDLPHYAMLITDAGEPTYSHTQENTDEWADSRCRSRTPNALIYKPVTDDSTFDAEMNVPGLGVDDPGLHHIWWSLRPCKRGDTNMTLHVDANIQVAPVVLGYLMAACRETPEASWPAPICPPTGHLKLLFWGGSRGATGVRQVEALVPSLRSLIKSGRIYHQVADGRPTGIWHQAGVIVEISTTRGFHSRDL